MTLFITALAGVVILPLLASLGLIVTVLEPSARRHEVGTVAEK